MDVIRDGASNEEILKKIKDNAGVFVTASDENLDGISITNKAINPFFYLRRLGLNESYSFELIATRGDEISEPIAINITHILGSFSFQSYPTIITFEEQLGTSSSKLYKSIPNIGLFIVDTRTYGSKWTLQVSATTLENDDSRILQGQFKYINGTDSITINDTMQSIRTETQSYTGPSTVDISKIGQQQMV
ncbi:hypothetical protein [Carnobacterium maltaromaticum]|uniref:hypothetical protein n=1 Tax=Carnobacterium maltaromaticum TaxID=2751 RepID=UPI0012F8F0A3|nr:hypothetical protein [Carnobacterium maltaromaticum]